MVEQTQVLKADREFFDALLGADVEALDLLIIDDFIIVDVMSGGETDKRTLLDALRSGQLKFLAIEPSETRARIYGAAAVVNGRTRMKLSFDDQPIDIKSRYTHVYVSTRDRWRMVSAQGTRITD